MKIIILDARPLDVGDLDWTPLEGLGELVKFEHTTPDQVVERIQDADAVFSNKVQLARTAIEQAPNLKFIGVLATGFDNIDIEAARERNITVCNVRGYSADFSAQTAWALLLELCHRAGEHSRLVFDGEWARCPDFSFWRFPLVELANKRLLVVGAGNIGGRVARFGQAFGMSVATAQMPGRGPKPDESWARVPLDQGLAHADVVSLHVPLNDQTRGLMNAERLTRMKRGALLVNTARGPLIDASAVRTALESGQLGGFAADVLEAEPPPAEHPLYGTPNCILTPHLAWASPEARKRLLETSIENLRAFLQGQPQNVVS